MAAHDYFQTSYHNDLPADPYHDYDGPSSLHTPLPPPPDPPLSPFGDRKYAYAHPTPSPSYAGGSGRMADEADPFDDDNAIPLRGRKSKHDSTTTLSRILPPQTDDPFVRDVDPGKQRRRGRRSSREGWFSGRITWVVYILTLVQLIVFLAEIIRNAILTKTPIEIHPSFNPMIGPSPYVMINMGARYQPCMHNMVGVQNSSETISWPCPNATATTGDSVTCSLSDLCGGGGVPNPHPNGTIHDHPAPNQSWRFVAPIFLHAGIVHIGFNLILQLTLGRDVEKLIGPIRFAVVYFAAGIFGFVLGGNFAASGIASCGCSGSLFGILAITLLDLLYTWRERDSPIRDLLFIGVDVCIAFVLGLLPGLDNFSHIGGFLMGLVLGICLLRSPTAISRRTAPPPPGSFADHDSGLRAFAAAPLAFFQNRRGVWWAWWLVRAAALLGALVAFILLLKNFYREPPVTCSWCKYLSCLPVTVGGTNWCQVGNLNFTQKAS